MRGGRDEVRRHFARNASAPITLRTRDVRVHETADPEVIVAEYDYDLRAAAGGEGVTVATCSCCGCGTA